jgi:hypothetical protein
MSFVNLKKDQTILFHRVVTNEGGEVRLLLLTGGNTNLAIVCVKTLRIVVISVI